MKKKNIFQQSENIQDLILNIYPFFSMSPEYGRNLFQKKFLKFYKNQKKNKEIIFKLNRFDKLYFPYFKTGNTHTLGLFAYHEHNIFLFYFLKRFNYKYVADIGANIGLHTIILSKFGYRVDSYEPDPDHFKILKKYVKKNNCKNVKLFNKAVFDSVKTLNFTKVLNNPAANHIAGQKPLAYGPLKNIKIKTVDVNNIIQKYDLVKLDAEGSEGLIIENISQSQLKKTDIIVEISGLENAKKIFNHCKKNKIYVFSHKILWKQVSKLDEMPIHHTEGLVFISKNKKILNFV
jgi:FkbM family methyltransferase